MKRKFISVNFHPKSLALIQKANAIIADLKSQGFTLTLRQLYYQMVSMDLIPNNQRQYDRLGDVISNARLAGLIDWDAIEDRTRFPRGNSHWTGPAAVINSALHAFALDKWSTQDWRVEVWVEKDALVGVVGQTAQKLDVGYFSCRGYASQTALYNAARRFEWYRKEKKKVCVLHLGDHDPSGCDMSRDINDRLALLGAPRIEVKRIALTMAQVEENECPPNPAKTTDCRYAKYAEEHGDESWELDALPPRVLAELIEREVLALRNEEQWDEQVERESGMRERVKRISERENRWEKRDQGNGGRFTLRAPGRPPIVRP